MIRRLIVTASLFIALTGSFPIPQAFATQPEIIHNEETVSPFSICERNIDSTGLPSSVKKYTKYRLEEGFFECEIPEDWVNRRDRNEDKRTRVYGTIFVLKDSRAGIKPWIDVSYYTIDNTYFISAADYLNRQFEPPIIKLEGEEISAVREVLVNGHAAKQFTKDTLGFWPPHSMNAKEIKVREEYTVLEIGREFCVLIYSAPDSQFLEYRPDYQHILDTFRAYPTVHSEQK
ncbi:MAG TPA: hypothetical protein VMU29_11915 [Smithella sp.]|nr:hypothetical protein [Smithella sp.]